MRRERKYNIKGEDLGLWMNSCSTVWTSYYTKAWEYWPFVEVDAVCFCGFVAIFFLFLYGLSRLMRMLLEATQIHLCWNFGLLNL